MAILGAGKSEIEVRLYKLPQSGPDPEYFNEYAPLREWDRSLKEITRHIVPEDGSYGIEIAFKAGFIHGKYNGSLAVLLEDAKSGAELYNEELATDGELEHSLQEDMIYHIESLPYAVVGGKARGHVGLAFQSLHPDELSDINDDDTDETIGITMTIARSSKTNLVPKSDEELKQARDKFGSMLTSQADDTIVSNTNINDFLFHKAGLTHGLKLVGGTALKDIPRICSNWNKPKHIKQQKFRFLCRSKEYLDRSDIVKTPIAIESRLWSCLNDIERKSTFKILQDYDRDHTLKQSILEAGCGIDTSRYVAIRKQLFEGDELAVRWRGWGSLLKREREGQFNKLQIRRSFFEKGQYPPGPGTASQSISNRAGSSEKAIEAKVEDVKIQSSVVVKQKPKNVPQVLATTKAQSQIIILDDSDEEIVISNNRGKTSYPPFNDNQGQTIKKEPIEVLTNGSSSSRMPSENLERPAKRIKTEPAASSSPIQGHDSELLRLKEEDERKEEELAVLQQVAQALRERNVRKARIADLEAQK